MGNQLEATVHLVLLPPVGLVVICLLHSQRLRGGGQKTIYKYIYTLSVQNTSLQFLGGTITHVQVSSYYMTPLQGQQLPSVSVSTTDNNASHMHKPNPYQLAYEAKILTSEVTSGWAAARPPAYAPLPGAAQRRLWLPPSSCKQLVSAAAAALGRPDGY